MHTAGMLVADGGRGDPSPTVLHKVLSFLGHPEQANKGEPRDLDRANRARARYASIIAEPPYGFVPDGIVVAETGGETPPLRNNTKTG